MAINQDKLHEFLGKAIVDFGATFNAALIRIGDRLGLYKALAAGGGQKPPGPPKKKGTAARLICDGVSARAPRGYLTHQAGPREKCPLGKRKILAVRRK